MPIPKKEEVLPRLRREDARNERRLKREKRRERDVIEGGGMDVRERNLRSVSLDSVDEEDEYTDEADTLMCQLQLLNYSVENTDLRNKFILIVTQHITFNGICPAALTPVGHCLIQNGQFHSLWAKSLTSSRIKINLNDYYNVYYSLIIWNHSCFQQTFNGASFSQDHPFEFNLQQLQVEQSLKTNSRSIREDIQENNEEEDEDQNQNQNVREEKEMHMIDFDSLGGRVRLLGTLQSNQRRHQLEIACFFLHIKQVLQLEKINIVEVLEWHSNSKVQFAILRVKMPIYSTTEGKVMMSIQPKCAIALGSFLNLSQLLRLQLTFGDIEILAYYDQLLNLPAWLRSNGFINENEADQLNV